MSREDEVDHKMLKGFYFAYKGGTPYPSTMRDSSLQDINITVDEFIASRRRLMQNGFYWMVQKHKQEEVQFGVQTK